jgi:hypothetical protein
MKVIKLEKKYYIGIAIVPDESPISDNETTIDLPTGMLVDADHCPKLVDSKNGQKWVNDDSPTAKAISAKYHVSDLPVGLGDSNQPQATA